MVMVIMTSSELRVENFQNNRMQIFNRWGVLIYSVYGYGGTDGTQNVFTGYSDGRTTISKR